MLIKSKNRRELGIFIKEIPNGFCVWLYSDPNTRDVARLEKSVKNTSRKASVFSFSKVE